MATLITEVDRSHGNYQDVFIYTINASFNGIVGDINSALIKVFFPDILNVYLGDVKSPVKEVREDLVTGGKYVIFDLGAIEDLGIALRLGLGVTFKNSTESGAQYILNPEMIINGNIVLDYEGNVIELSVTPRFEISREIVLPKTSPAAGGAIFYKVTLQNFGDLGGAINNISIKCNSADEIDIDPDFVILGGDNSSSDFEDLSQDGILGTVSLNSVDFFIPSYYGEKYEFIYRAVVSNNALAGLDFNTTATLSIDGISKHDDVHTFSLGSPIYDASISIYGPDYTLPSEYICYEISVENIGNQVLEQVDLTKELPQEINYYEFKTGTFYFGEINQEIDSEYFIYYETVNGNSGQLGPYNASSNTSINLNTFIPDDDNLIKLTWSLLSLGVGVKTKKPPHIKGIVKSDTQIQTSILNHLAFTWVVLDDLQTRIDNHSTIVNDMCVLMPISNPSATNFPVKPSEIIRYNIGANCRASRLSNPIIAMILSEKLEYVGNVNASYFDLFESGTSVSTPEPVIIENFNDNGDTLVKFAFTDDYSYNFKQKSRINIEFDTRVKIGAQGTILSSMILNTSGSTGVISPTTDVYRDTDNIHPSVSNNYAQSAQIENMILFFVSVKSDKKVKGLMDTEFVEQPDLGIVAEGSEVEYKITITNTGNADLEKIVVIDILPYIGDTGVTEIFTNRNSDFTIYTVSEVVAKILPENSSAELDIFYSESTDPIRFGSTFNTIGTDSNWQSLAPDRLIDIKSFKIESKNTKLLPNQTLEIMIKTAVPVGTAISKIAWNSFAADVTYKDISNTEKHLLAIEPEKVGILVTEPPQNKGQIGGFVWFDTNKDGLISQNELGISDVGVVLYKQDGTPIKATFTTPNFNGDEGYFLFSNLDIEKYYVKFFIEDDKYDFTNQKFNFENGSIPYPQTGITPLIDLTLNKTQKNINAGIINKQNYSIEKIINVNKSARSMIRNVVYNKMLISMKYENVIDLIENME